MDKLTYKITQKENQPLVVDFFFNGEGPVSPFSIFRIDNRFGSNTFEVRPPVDNIGIFSSALYADYSKVEVLMSGQPSLIRKTFKFSNTPCRTAKALEVRIQIRWGVIREWMKSVTEAAKTVVVKGELTF